MTAPCVRREKAALSSGCKSHPANAPAGSNRSSHGGDEMAEVSSVWLVTYKGDGASVRAATLSERRASLEKDDVQTDPTAISGKSWIRLGEMSEDDAQPLHRGTGGSTHTRKARATREAPKRGQVRDDRTPTGTPVKGTGRGAVGWREEVRSTPRKPGNSGGGKGPQFKTDAERGEGHGDWATYQLHLMFRSCRWRRTRKTA